MTRRTFRNYSNERACARHHSRKDEKKKNAKSPRVVFRRGHRWHLWHIDNDVRIVDRHRMKTGSGRSGQSAGLSGNGNTLTRANRCGLSLGRASWNRCNTDHDRIRLAGIGRRRWTVGNGDRVGRYRSARLFIFAGVVEWFEQRTTFDCVSTSSSGCEITICLQSEVMRRDEK